MNEQKQKNKFWYYLYLLILPSFWRSLPKILFVNLFWEGLAGTIIFLLMIPAIKGGNIPLWLALIGSAIMGIASQYFSKTYDSVNPIRGIYHKIKKKKKNN